MRGDRSPADVRQLLSQRADVLSTLLEGDRTKRDLTEGLDVSRSTVDRAIRTLESNGLAQREGGMVTATLAGRLAYDAYEQYCDETEHVAQYGDLLRELPPTAEIGHAMLDGATAYRSEPPATGRPSDEVVALFRTGDRVRGCAKVINDSNAAEVFYRMITERGGHGEVVYTPDLADLFRTQYFRMTHELASTGRYRAYEIDSLPYELFLVEGDGWTRVAVLIYADGERLRGAILNDTDAAVAWAEATFERYRDAATEFTSEFRVGESADRSGPDGDGTGEAGADNDTGVDGGPADGPEDAE